MKSLPSHKTSAELKTALVIGEQHIPLGYSLKPRRKVTFEINWTGFDLDRIPGKAIPRPLADRNRKGSIYALRKPEADFSVPAPASVSAASIRSIWNPAKMRKGSRDRQRNVLDNFDRPNRETGRALRFNLSAHRGEVGPVESGGRVAGHHSRFRVRAALLQEGQEAKHEDKQEDHGDLQRRRETD